MPNIIGRLYTLLPGGTPIPGVSLPDRASLPDPATLRVPIRGVSQNGRRGTTPAAGGASVHHSAGVARSRVPIGKREGQRGAGLRRYLGRGGCILERRAAAYTSRSGNMYTRGRGGVGYPTDRTAGHAPKVAARGAVFTAACGQREGRGHCVEAQGNGTSRVRVSPTEWCVRVCIRVYTGVWRCVYGAFSLCGNVIVRIRRCCLC